MSVTEKRTTTQQTPEIMSSSTNRIVSWLGEGLRQTMLFPALRLFAPTQVYGLDKLKGEGPYIFAPNHASHLDTPLLLAALPLRLRLQIRIAAASDYFFASHWKGMLVSLLLNAFPFKRKGADSLMSLTQAQQLLEAGHSLLVFPEGTRTKDGHLQHFKWGVGKLALDGASVVPVWIGGTYDAFPKGARWPHRHNVIIRFGVPMGFTANSDPSTIAAAIEQQVAALERIHHGSEKL